MRAKAPEHWKGISWEEKARENPLSAVMTTSDMTDAPPDDFSPEQLDAFFAKGRALWSKHVAPLLKDAPAGALVTEYGCGAGRILRAAVDDGYVCAGIDISPTMLGHCARLVPEAALYALDPDGRCAAPSGSAALVFSYSVLQHIASLKNYITAVDQMCRVLKPGGVLAVQLNCEDFNQGDLDAPGRTENFEDHSLHFHPGADKAYKRHPQDEWSGVYVGAAYFTALLAERGVTAERWYYHNPNKLRAMWVVGRKAA